MDCEKVESVLMDELYGDLDELTSAAVKRHVAGCARCSAVLDGFRATRRLASLPLVEPSYDLEARILDAALPRATVTLGALAAAPQPPVAQAVAPEPAVSFGRRLAQIVSIAGTWAMRPQTAMAALFLVMVGVSVPLLRGKSSRAAANAEVRVTEQGMPAPAATTQSVAAASAAPEPAVPLGAFALKPDAPALPKLARAPASAEEFRELASAKGEGRDAKDKEAHARDRASSGALADNAPPRRAFAEGPGGAAGAVPARPTPAFAQSPPPPPAEAPPAEAMAAAAPAAAPPASLAPPAQAAGKAAADDIAPASPFDAALAAYRARRYADANRAFEALAPTDPNADLWAARSLREARGCGIAASRFDQVARRAGGTPTGWDALLESAQCYRANGDVNSARMRLTSLLGVPGYKDRAQAELDRLSHAAAATRF
jgi:TolA-binding protein